MNLLLNQIVKGFDPSNACVTRRIHLHWLFVYQREAHGTYVSRFTHESVFMYFGLTGSNYICIGSIGKKILFSSVNGRK